jgi:hypothetical protein
MEDAHPLMRWYSPLRGRAGERFDPWYNAEARGEQAGEIMAAPSAIQIFPVIPR